MVEYPIVVYDPPIWTVYMHVNKINGKKYVGITSQKPQKRWSKDGRGYNSKNSLMRKAILKYGWDNFDHIIILDKINKIQAQILERYYIKYYHSHISEHGYNISIGGEGATGVKPSNRLDLTGMKFGKLTVTGYAFKKNNRIYWHCICECGNHKDVQCSKLTSGNTVSCGCYRNSFMASEYQKTDNKIEFQNGYCIGHTPSGHDFIFDQDDYPMVSQYHFIYRKQRNLIMDMGKRIKNKQLTQSIMLANLILGLPSNNPLVKISHLNDDIFDFRKCNLKLYVPSNISYEDYYNFLKMDLQYIVWDNKRKSWKVMWKDRIPLKYFPNLQDGIEYLKSFENEFGYEFYIKGGNL